MKRTLICTTPIGRLTLKAADGLLCHIIFEEQAGADVGGPVDEAALEAAEDPTMAVLRETRRQLEEYFTGKRRVFDLPLFLGGTTHFTRETLRAVAAIPYGETRSYGQIAETIGSPRAFRAVGMANHNNPLPIVIPCHRVVGAKGGLTGYAGGLWRKQFLLDLEKSK